tara:strand:+ start:461 stop:1261 length:801 start_codon:yes stop_codon:yes gene_type:complete
MKCLICSTVFKNEGYLHKAFENIKKIYFLFEETKIIICYDNSGDNSLKELCELKKYFNIDIIMNNKERFNSPDGRAYNIAQARNQILELIYTKYSDYDYFIMCDLDDVMCVDINLLTLQRFIPINDHIPSINDWEMNNWDALSFYNEGYYDCWALSIDEYDESCWHKDTDGMVEGKKMLKYLKNKLDNTDNSMIKVDSAFNGFAIHKLSKFKDIRYTPATILNGKIIIDCEHRKFYKDANEKKLNIMMCKYPLFSSMKHIVPELYD